MATVARKRSTPQQRVSKAGNGKAPALDADYCRRVFRLAVTSRLLDDATTLLRKRDEAFFQISSAGHEIVQICCALALKPGFDGAWPYYRDQAFVLGYGVSAEQILLNAVGAKTSQSEGRDIYVVWSDKNLNILPQSGPVATQYNQAVGYAEAEAMIRRIPELKRRFNPGAETRITYVSGGEASTAPGDFAESLNAACIRKLAVLFCIQNNRFAISVPVEEEAPHGDVAGRWERHPGLKTIKCDGTDIESTAQAVAEAVAYLRQELGPVLLLAECTRPRGHSFTDDPKRYKLPEEIEAEDRQDCIFKLEQYLLARGFATPEEIVLIRAEAEAEVKSALEAARKAPRVVPEELPRHAYSEATDPTDRNLIVPRLDGEPVKMVDAINRCYKEAMARDVRICLFGEDVASGRPEILGRLPGKGGVFGVTQGLQELYGDRVHNTQLAESYIVGSACGKALRGLIPIGEIQFGDFVWDAMAQIKKEIATMCWRTAGKWAPHLVVYVPVGYVHGGSIWHSEDVSSIFTHITGLRIPYPSNAADAVGLMNTALFHCQDPVLFCAHKGLYQAIASRAPYPGEGYTVPFGCASVLQDGTHCTIVTWGAMVHTSLEAAQALAADQISVEVIDLRTIAPVDWEAIARSVEKTGHLVVVHEDTLTSGFGAELAARAAQDLFWALDGPIQRVASVDAYVPYDPKLVSAYLPGVEDICRAVRSALA